MYGSRGLYLEKTNSNTHSAQKWRGGRRWHGVRRRGGRQWRSGRWRSKRLCAGRRHWRVVKCKRIAMVKAIVEGRVVVTLVLHLHALIEYVLPCTTVRHPSTTAARALAIVRKGTGSSDGISSNC